MGGEEKTARAIALCEALMVHGMIPFVLSARADGTGPMELAEMAINALGQCLGVVISGFPPDARQYLAAGVREALDLWIASADDRVDFMGETLQ